jgi:Asp-tRNA(Asn)/Glu-tRNA(Gln) amidotransferase B subunit
LGDSRQDTAKTTKLADGSTHIDLNRAGMGLMEIVTEADMRLAELTFNRSPTSNCFAIWNAD